MTMFFPDPVIDCIYFELIIFAPHQIQNLHLTNDHFTRFFDLHTLTKQGYSEFVET